MVLNKIFLFLFVYLMEISVNVDFCSALEDGDDLHSSVTALHDVFNTEKHLMEYLENYILGSKDKIEFVKGIFNVLKKDHKKMAEGGTMNSTKEDPLNMFMLKKRIAISLPNLHDYLRKLTKTMAENYIEVKRKFELPGENDLDGVTLGLLRIQEVYNITAEQIANGNINGLNFKTTFTAADCLEVATRLSESKFYHYAIEWYKMVIKRTKDEGWKGILTKINEIIISISLANAQYLEGSFENIKGAIDILIKTLKNNYDDMHSYAVAESLFIIISHYNTLISKGKRPISLYPPIGTLLRYNLTELDLLKRSCRGELKKTPKEERNLFCKYETNNHLFLLIAPIKVEVMNFSPYIIVCHDVIYDSEIEILKELSLQKLTRARVWNQVKGRREASAVRTGKNAWIPNSTHPLMQTLNQRVHDMTGLTMETAEEFQIMNYGIGGHYDIHPDYFTEPKPDNDIKPYCNFENGNRIATVLFYMSDVAHGGGTTWPNINVLTLPKKGCAAFWYNLFADGEPDYNSRHSACPIISGSKWVLNKWIRSRGQEFKRPCLTYPDHLGKPKV